MKMLFSRLSLLLLIVSFSLNSMKPGFLDKAPPSPEREKKIPSSTPDKAASSSLSVLPEKLPDTDAFKTTIESFHHDPKCTEGKQCYAQLAMFEFFYHYLKSYKNVFPKISANADTIGKLSGISNTASCIFYFVKEQQGMLAALRHALLSPLLHECKYPILDEKLALDSKTGEPSFDFFQPCCLKYLPAQAQEIVIKEHADYLERKKMKIDDWRALSVRSKLDATAIIFLEQGKLLQEIFTQRRNRIKEHRKTLNRHYFDLTGTSLKKSTTDKLSAVSVDAEKCPIA